MIHKKNAIPFASVVTETVTVGSLLASDGELKTTVLYALEEVITLLLRSKVVILRAHYLIAVVGASLVLNTLLKLGLAFVVRTGIVSTISVAGCAHGFPAFYCGGIWKSSWSCVPPLWLVRAS